MNDLEQLLEDEPTDAEIGEMAAELESTWRTVLASPLLVPIVTVLGLSVTVWLAARAL